MMVRRNVELIEHFAKLIALWHGQKIVLHNRDGNQTVASLHGYGHYGDASERYMHAHWEEYTSAAEAVLAEFKQQRQSKGWRKAVRTAKRNRRHQVTGEQTPRTPLS